MKSNDQNYNLGWTHVLRDKATFDLNAYARARPTSSCSRPTGDTPVTATSDRSLDNYGVAPSVTWITGAHEVKLGGVYKRFPIDERFSFGITDPGFNDPESDGYNANLAPYDLTRGGALFDFSAEAHRDVLRPLRTGQHQVEGPDREPRPALRPQRPAEHGRRPRAANRPRVLHHRHADRAAGRLQPGAVHARVREHPAELLGAGRRARAAGRDRLRAARQRRAAGIRGEAELLHAGRQQALGSKLRVDADVWWRRGTGAGDQDQFFNTGIVFPISFAEGQVQRLGRPPGPRPHPRRARLLLARSRSRDLRAAADGRAVPGQRGDRRGHRRAVPDRPRPEAAGPGPAALGHRHERSVARRERPLRLRARDGRESRGPGAGSERLLRGPLRGGAQRHRARPEPHQGADDRELLPRGWTSPATACRSPSRPTC